jgi:hypothetical protein
MFRTVYALTTTGPPEHIQVIIHAYHVYGHGLHVLL